MSITETNITVDAQMPKGGDSNNSDAAASVSAATASASAAAAAGSIPSSLETLENIITLDDQRIFKDLITADAEMPKPADSNNSAAAAIPSTQATHFEAPEIYRAAVAGDVALFRRRLEELESPSVLTNSDKFRSSRGNTVLHLAGQSGCDELVLTILRQPGLADLLCRENSSKNTPLQEAVIAGNLSTVRVLVSFARENPRPVYVTRTGTDQTEEIAAVDFLLGFGNKDGNSALHLALSEGYHENESIASFLFEENSEVTHFVNKEEKCPLYMAAEKGYVALFEVMMQKPLPSQWSSSYQRVYRIWIAHAAISAKSIGT